MPSIVFPFPCKSHNSIGLKIKLHRSGWLQLLYLHTINRIATAGNDLRLINFPEHRLIIKRLNGFAQYCELTGQFMRNPAPYQNDRFLMLCHRIFS